ncbi:ubiquitin-like protein Pup [Devriesea agamarum]|uniref:ubiquitin-like protein Pup n=1 Tax=Devriesea agamarum TaxID=472569 RepID=UPI00071DE694|nr:ubiquitin-like protein Pup [Devriesea agamarum]
MSQIFVTPGSRGDDHDEVTDAVAPAGQTHAQTQATDDLLDEIDQVLESNADTFVRSFVQKGGQ